MVRRLICANCNSINEDRNLVCGGCGCEFMQTVSTPLQTGDLLAKRYQIVAKAGEGGMSIVYQAIDQDSYQNYAIKEIRGNLLVNHPEIIEQFSWESHLLMTLKHPKLPQGYGYYTQDGRYYIVMAFIEGNTLESLIQHTGQGMAAANIVAVAKQLFAVIGYLHSQMPPVVIRDIKPSNIILQPNGGVKLIDLSIARHFKELKTEDTHAWGTRAFAAPEAQKQYQTTPQSDIYSLGMTLYYLLTAQSPPISLKAKAAFNPTAQLKAFNHPVLANLILKATQFKADERWQSVAEMQQFLGEQTNGATGDNKATHYFTETRTNHKPRLSNHSNPAPNAEHGSLFANFLSRLQLNFYLVPLMWVIMVLYWLGSRWLGGMNFLGGQILFFGYVGLMGAVVIALILSSFGYAKTNTTLSKLLAVLISSGSALGISPLDDKRVVLGGIILTGVVAYGMYQIISTRFRV